MFFAHFPTRFSCNSLLLSFLQSTQTAPSLPLILAIVLAVIVVVQSVFVERESSSSSVTLCEVIGQSTSSSSSSSSSAMSSFVPVPADSDFPIQNLPFGVFSTQDKVKKKRR